MNDNDDRLAQELGVDEVLDARVPRVVGFVLDRQTGWRTEALTWALFFLAGALVGAVAAAWWLP
jgi:hypothetical protein